MVNITQEEQDRRKQIFLEELGKPEVAGNVLIACTRLKNVSRTSVYEYRKQDPVFAKAWDSVIEDSRERFADEAEHSLRKLVVENNHPTATIFALKNLRPKKWRDRHTGEDNSPIKHTHEVSPDLQKVLARVASRLNGAVKTNGKSKHTTDE